MIQKTSSPKSEGAGNAGCALHPAVSRAKNKQNCTRAYRAAEAIRHSPRNGFTAYSALSLATGLVCHHRPRDAFASRELDASVGASGPHGFAVRFGPTRLEASKRPPHPAANVRDDRETPLWKERDGRKYRPDSVFLKNRIFLQRGLDRLSDRWHR